MENQLLQGALIDERSEEEKKKDYYIGETVTRASDVFWEEKPESKWRKFPGQNQGFANSCVANTARKLLRIIFFLITGKDLDFSDAHIYIRRSNKPAGGMGGVDVFEIMKQGCTLYSLMPSDQKGDEDLDKMVPTELDKQVGEAFKIDNYVQFDKGDFETVASTIQTTGKGVMVWFYFTHAEWSKLIPTVDDPKLNLYANSTSRHSVTAVDFTLKDGKKYLIIEDSALFGGLDRRLISGEFFKARNFFSAYPINFKYAVKKTFKPEFNLKNKLIFGMATSEVVNLQDILKYLGFFAYNVDSTGQFGGVTLKAVKEFQKKYGLKVDGVVGPATRSELLYQLNNA